MPHITNRGVYNHIHHKDLRAVTVHCHDHQLSNVFFFKKLVQPLN